MCSGLILISPSKPITKYFCVLQSHCHICNILSSAAGPCLSCWAINNSQFTFSAFTGDFWKMFMISVTLHNFIICSNITQNFMNIFWQKDLYICFMTTSLQTLKLRCTDPGHITQSTKFGVMVPDIFSTLLKFYPLHTEMCRSSHIMSRKHQITVRFTGHSRMWGSQVTQELWVPSMELACCHPSST